jgi:hypothetical protein
MKRDIDIIRQLDDTEDAIKRARLRTMQAVALGLLVLAALLFALARSQHGGHPAWGYLEAFSEAAMVGAIADWFAVTALFRHPLGIPLWHTAIIPNSKDSIGKSLGNFVENHFITEEGIARRIRQVDIAGRAGRYMQTNAAQLSAWVGPALEKLLQMADHDKIRGAGRRRPAAAVGGRGPRPVRRLPVRSGQPPGHRGDGAKRREHGKFGAQICVEQGHAPDYSLVDRESSRDAAQPRARGTPAAGRVDRQQRAAAQG